MILDPVVEMIESRSCQVEALSRPVMRAGLSPISEDVGPVRVKSEMPGPP